MFSPHKQNSPLSSSFQQPVYQNQKQIRSIESKYFNDQYQKSINQKLEKQEEEKLKKRQQLEAYQRKNQEYLNSVAMNRFNRYQEKQYMAEQYDEMINMRKFKQQEQKRNQKSFERDILGQRTWIRDQSQQREMNKMKVNRYSQQLEMHVKAQQQRVKQQQQLQKQMRQKINQQAQQILNKQIQQLQQRQRRKDLFEQRQNELLGGNYQLQDPISPNPNASMVLNSSSLTNSRTIEQISLRKRQQQLYGHGLQIQRQVQEQRKKRQPSADQGYKPGQYYNPITNPIPVVYKNPNVLRMLSQK